MNMAWHLEICIYIIEKFILSYMNRYHSSSSELAVFCVFIIYFYTIAAETEITHKTNFEIETGFVVSKKETHIDTWYVFMFIKKCNFCDGFKNSNNC